MIATERLILTPLDLEDADTLHALWTTPGVRRYLWDDVVIPMAQTLAIVEESIAAHAGGRYGLWTVRLADRDDLAGFTGFWPFFDPPQIQLLYGLDSRLWSRGYATEMARAMLEVGFQRYRLDAIRAATDTPNAASERVMQRIGLKREREAAIDGKPTVFYRLDRDAWMPR